MKSYQTIESKKLAVILQMSWAALLVLLIILLCSPIIASPPKPLLDVLASIDEIRKRENIAAVGLSFVEEGKLVWSGGLGTFAHNSKRPVTAETIYRIGSITKSFTSLATLKLAAKNQLTLNERISKWIPPSWYHNHWQQQHPISIMHLLEHTAGFRDISKAEFDFNEPKPTPLADTLTRYKDSHHTAWTPGLHSSYSNLGAAFVGFIIEQVSQQNFEIHVAQALFKPLNMHHSGFFLNSSNTSQLATGYDTDGTTKIPYWHMVYRPFGGINSTPADMGNFVQMLINKGRYQNKQVFRSNLITQMEIPRSTVAARSGLAFGYGLGSYHWLRNGILFHGHGGDADGYLSHYGYTRSNNSGYFVVITAFNYPALRGIRRLIERHLVKNLPKPEFPAIYPMDKIALNKISGIYRNVTSRFVSNKQTMRITVEGDLIHTQTDDGPKFELIPVSKTHFRRKHESLATTAIVQTADGEVYFQDDSNNFQKISDILKAFDI